MYMYIPDLTKKGQAPSSPLPRSKGGKAYFANRKQGNKTKRRLHETHHRKRIEKPSTPTFSHDA